MTGATSASLSALIEQYRLDVSSEATLQDAIAVVLTENAIPFEREARLDAHSRPDFMVGSVAVEVKIGGSWAALVRQLQRYAKHERVTEILVVSSRARLARVPRELAGKPVAVAVIIGGIA